MDTYTAMSNKGINAVVHAGNKEFGDGHKKMELSLNASDFGMLVLTLQAAYEHTADGGCESATGQYADSVSEWAAQWASDLAGAVGIEFV